MTYIITEPCVGVCDTACVDVCPVDCIHFNVKNPDAGQEMKDMKAADPNVNLDGLQLFIDPEECIDCAACEPECPVEAIFVDEEVPDEWEKYIAMNYEAFGQEAP
ncbi:ferredoxin family protein [Patescibacteria group bacterium AH-259-L07]|nr:ferredoxin family protein [Patescibacteria group bacterium AH-259-L07]